MSSQTSMAVRARIDKAIDDVYVALDRLQFLPPEDAIVQLQEGLEVARRIEAKFAAAKGGVS